MNVYISKNGQRLGPYSVDEAQRLKTAGQLQDKDWAWYEGLAEWIALDQVPGFVSVPATMMPPPSVSASAQGNAGIFVCRLLTAAAIFCVLFVFFFVVIFMVSLMVGGAISGMEASQAQQAAPQNFHEGYNVGYEAGREFGAKYRGLIAGIAALVSLLLSALSAWGMAFSNMLPWCRRQ